MDNIEQDDNCLCVTHHRSKLQIAMTFYLEIVLWKTFGYCSQSGSFTAAMLL